jgi:ribosomal protein L11 methyltransferase
VDRVDALELAAYADGSRIAAARAMLGAGAVELVEAGWEDAWKRFHKPVRIGPLWIGPPWETPDADSLAVVIDPGRAFGTGAHPTTRLCVELLLELPRSSLVDIGCGSGVLAVAAARLGFSPVHALDADPLALEATRMNAAANGVRLEASLLDAEADPLPRAEAAVANIALEQVERIARRVASSRLVASGYPVGRQVRVPGWRLARRKECDGWAAKLLEAA